MKRVILGLALVCLLLPACNKKKKARAALATLCVESGERLSKGDGDTDHFMLELQNALTACSAACDLEDEGSCAALEQHVTKICGVSTTTCDSLCSSVKSPSLKKSTCAHSSSPK
ncbi:MAG: hypothetical protein OZ921_09375 [Sorangiineae bacterium]|nr:hypothetical protein [Polyangiaceae bacterium]MEB2322714.1 hypothetical protein [Sorangiineae bacterium]